jgi:CRISPR/Cas system endoribonuclease Cas6 (RAMP superfamily)
LATEIPSREMQTYTYAEEKKSQIAQKYKILGNEIERVSEEKDIGVTIDDELTFEKHTQEKIKKANSTFAATRRSFKYLKVDTFLPLYKSMVRSHLDYVHSVWAQYKKGIID